jgi:hypothetical protein
MNRVEALKSVVAALQAEIAALKAFDIDALALATGAKEEGVGVLAGDWADEPITPEVRALAQEAAMLNETSRIYVNLMSANIRTRLDALTGMAQQVYAPRSAAA